MVKGINYCYCTYQAAAPSFYYTGGGVTNAFVALAGS